MPPAKIVALALLLMDAVLLTGFLYVIFAPQALSFARRTRILRYSFLAGAFLGISVLPFAGAARLIPGALAANALLILVMGILLARKASPHRRRQDPTWLQQYIQRLETEMRNRSDIERELAFIAGVAERDPNSIIEISVDGTLGYRDPAAVKTFPDLDILKTNHPVLAGLHDAAGILRRDGKESLRRPFRYGDRVFEQQITWSRQADRLCLYMTDVTEWKRLDQMKTELLNTVSHEFRTPLSGILATTQMIQAGMLGEVTADQAKMIGVIGGSATRLNRLISDLLDISKVEAGKAELRRQEFDAAALVGDIALMFGPVAKNQGLELVTDIGETRIPCLADADKLTQVLTNLTNNALKFTREGRITLSVHTKGSDLHFAVSDTGIGIPAEQMHKVFGKFQQFGAAVHGEKGSGLGLSLSKNLVELHRGQMKVESRLGKGPRSPLRFPT